MSSGSCSCVMVYIDEGYAHWEDAIVVAGTEWTCVECGRTIEIGEEYEHSRGGELDEDDEPVDLDDFETCIDCVSMRTAFFCEGWFIGRTWDDLFEHLYDVCGRGDSVESACLVELTPRARAKVCDAIEEIWRDEDESDDRD